MSNRDSSQRSDRRAYWCGLLWVFPAAVVLVFSSMVVAPRIETIARLLGPAERARFGLIDWFATSGAEAGNYVVPFFVAGSLILSRALKSSQAVTRIRMIFAWLVNLWALVHVVCLAILPSIIMPLLEVRTDKYRELSAYFGIVERVEFGWNALVASPPSHKVEEFPITAHATLESYEIEENVSNFILLARFGRPQLVRQASMASLMGLRETSQMSNRTEDLIKLASELSGEEMAELTDAANWFESVKEASDWQPLPLVRIIHQAP